MHKLSFAVWLALLALAFACQRAGEQEAPRVAVERDPNMPQLTRIAISDAAQVDSLLAAGVEVVVVEADHVIARVSSDRVSALQAGGLSCEPATEEDLVRRLVKVVVTDPAQVTELANLGLDIWEVSGDTVTAQAFDKYILQLRAQGWNVAVVQENVLDLVNKDSAKK